MGHVIADMSMSLDGYVADAQDATEQVFGWFFGGDVALPSRNPHITFQVSEGSAKVLGGALESVGALICGRRTFGLAGGWGGTHPMGVPVVVMTHDPPEGYEGAPFHFVSDGISSAVAKAQELAGDKLVGVASPDVTRQCLTPACWTGSTSTSSPSCSAAACRGSRTSPTHRFSWRGRPPSPKAPA